MSRFRELEEFKSRFPDKMDVEEMKKWRSYWTQHAQFLAPKVRKQAMKRVYAIDRAITDKETK